MSSQLENVGKYMQVLYENGSTSPNLTGTNPDVSSPMDTYWFWVWLIVLLFLALMILVCMIIKCMKPKREDKVELIPTPHHEVHVERARPVHYERREYGKESISYGARTYHETNRRVDLNSRLVEVRIASPGKDLCITKYDYDGEDWGKYSQAHWNEY
jgi:hypothetical protein